MTDYPPGFPWTQLFRKHSWWRSPKDRTFVIVGCWHKDDGSIERIDLLELGKEDVKTIGLEEMIRWLNQDMIMPASTMPGLPQN